MSYTKLLTSLFLPFSLFPQCVGTGTGCAASGGASGVSSFNTRTGAVTSTIADTILGLSSPTGAPTYTVVSGDKGYILKGTNAPIIRFPTVASVSAGFYFYIWADPASSTNIQVTDGATISGAAANTIFLFAGSTTGFITDGSNWFTLNYVPPMVAATSSTVGVLGIPNGAAIGSQDLPLMGGLSATTFSNYFTSTVGRFTGQTAAKTVLSKTSTVATDESYLVSANIQVTAVTTASFTATATYTDETNTSRTLTLPFIVLAGTSLNTITNVTGTGPYEGNPVHIRCKANTTIVIATVGTFTSVTYNVEAHIRHIQ